MTRFPPALAAAVPGIVLGLCSLWWTIGAPFGGGLWPPDAVNLPEAVLARNSGEVVRLMNAGEAPARRVPVRASLASGDDPIPLTGLEAAVWVRDATIVRLLLAHQGAINGATLLTLRCLNDQHPDTDVRTLLEQLDPAPWPDCAGVSVPGPRPD